jgi:hypothetical protein
MIKNAPMPFRPQPFMIAIVLAFASVAHAQDQPLPDSQAFLARYLTRAVSQLTDSRPTDHPSRAN